MDETKARALAAYPYGRPGEGEPSEVTETRDAFAKRIITFAADVRRDEREACRRTVVALHTNRPPDWTNYHPFIRDGHTRALSEAESAIRALSPQAGPDPTALEAELARYREELTAMVARADAAGWSIVPDGHAQDLNAAKRLLREANEHGAKP